MPPVDLSPLEQLFDLIAPYLPSSVASPLHTVLTLPTKLYQDPSQLVPLLLSIVALYAAFQSLLGTTRFFIRTVWFAIKWGGIAAALAAGYASYNGYNVAGDGGGLDTASRWGKSAFNAGKTGVNWWAGSGTTNRNTKSASGRKRTWAKPTNDGGWDDPDEVDLGKENDPLKFVQDAVLTFLGSGSGAASSSGAKGKGKKVKDESSWATKFAMNQAKQAWDGVAQGVKDGLGTDSKGKGKSNSKRR